MKIAIVGLTDQLRRELHAACQDRGFEILPEKDALDLTNEEISALSAIIDATDPATLDEAARAAWEDGGRDLALQLKDFPQVRFIRIGEAPEGSDNCCWTAFVPPEEFSPEKERCGMYVPATDFAIRNSMGESAISYADAALAIADELKTPHFIGKTFTAVSDTSRLQTDKDHNLVDLSYISGTMFKTRGAYFGIFCDFMGPKRSTLAYQGSKIVLVSRRSMPGDAPMISNELLYLYPTYKGERVGFAIRFGLTELTLTTAYGQIRICYADDKLMYIKGENGLGLQFEKPMRPKDIIKKRGEKAWEAVYRFRCSLLINPLAGDLDIRAPWNGKTGSTMVMGNMKPGEDGAFLLSLEEGVTAAKVREAYPTYEEALAATTKDFEDFLAKIPYFTEELKPVRIEAAWHEWSSMIAPSGLVKRAALFMTQGMPASSWQMVQNAVGLNHDFALATDLLVNMIDNIGERGQFPDFVFDGQSLCQGVHPPTQGWALNWLMRLHDFDKEMPKETLTYLYEGYGKMADWYMNTRDDDKDGLPQFDCGDESGYDDISTFVHHVAVEGPDIAAYMAILFKKLGEIAQILGRDDEAKSWDQRGDGMIKQLIEKLWNGKKFIALSNYTHEVIDSNAITDYLPFVLGDLLPQEIIDKMTEDLLVEGDFLSPVGLTTEKISSDQFRRAGFSRGYSLPPSNMMILTGMYMAGKKEEAKMIAKRVCEAMITSGISQLMDPIEEYRIGFSCTWPACGFLALADMAYNM